MSINFIVLLGRYRTWEQIFRKMSKKNQDNGVFCLIISMFFILCPVNYSTHQNQNLFLDNLNAFIIFNLCHNAHGETINDSLFSSS